MATVAQTKNETKTAVRPTLLRRAMWGNAIFSGVSGIGLALFSGTLTEMLGISYPTVLRIVGIVLVICAADLAWVTSGNDFDVRWGWTAVVLDLVWVIGSGVILAFELLPLTTLGWWMVAIVADIVFLFAVVQAVGIYQIRQAC